MHRRRCFLCQATEGGFSKSSHVFLAPFPHLPPISGPRYAVYALLNALHTISSLIFIIPPILYGIKTLACGYCAFYAYQLRERINGAQQIP